MTRAKRSLAPMHTTAVVLVAIATLACVGVVQPAMALMAGQECVGPLCEDQIACGQPAQPLAPSAPLAHALAVPPAVAVLAVAPRIEAVSAGPPSRVRTWLAVAPLAPRSPPVA